jgi:AcrR family transcriptional regulator
VSLSNWGLPLSQSLPAAPLRSASLLPERASADGTHRRLLEEALRLFGARGFHGVSVREIAQGAGVRASSMYAHLASKEQVLFELMLIGHEEHHDLLRRAVLEASNEPMAQVTHLVEAHIRFHAEYSLLARVANRELAALADDSRSRVLAVRSQSEQLFLDVIERGIRLGVFDVPDPWLAYAVIGGIGIRVGEWWELRPDYQVEDVVAAYSVFVRRMLTAGAAGAQP